MTQIMFLDRYHRVLTEAEEGAKQIFLGEKNNTLVYLLPESDAGVHVASDPEALDVYFDVVLHGFRLAAQFDVWHFGNTEQLAEELVQLVLNGVKTATASSYEILEHGNIPLPQKGEFSVITDWQGRPQCVIEMTDVSVVSFMDVTETFAREEGEGDLSLAFWREVHEHYFAKELEQIGQVFSKNSLVVCQQFRVLHIFHR